MNAQVWREKYTFISVFYCNSFIVSLVIGFNFFRYQEENYFFLVRMVSSVVIGVLFDFVSTKYCLMLIFSMGMCIGYWDFWVIAMLPVSLEILNLAYVCDIITDNCKLKALSEIITIQTIGSSLGMLMSLYFPSVLLSQIFVPSCCFILNLITISCFDEIPKALRPNINFNKEETKTHPKYLGIAICLLLMSSSETIENLFQEYFLKTPNTTLRFVPDLIRILIVPLAFYVFFQILNKKEVKDLLVYTLIFGSITWAGLVLSDLFYFSLIGTYITVPILKSCSFLIFSRVLGPYSAGIFFGFAFCIGNAIRLLSITEWWVLFGIGFGLLFCSALLLFLCKSKCEVHRDYVLSHNTFDNKSKKFLIKLKRASVLDTENS